MQPNAMQLETFRQTVWEYYRANKRDMPWRDHHDAYEVIVSEFMLQQTQVSRVIPKFQSFMHSFPTLESLAKAPLADVLVAWQGLGYNRRAKFLHGAAGGLWSVPEPYDVATLIQQPGIGPNTAAAIVTYAYNEPVVFIETNIRTVFLHEFFPNDRDITDKVILELVSQTVDRNNPREWYWALMDYGAFLKSQKLGSIARSKQYKKQSTFRGSLREMRGMILRDLTNGPMAQGQFSYVDDDRFMTACAGLLKDGLIERHNDGIICLTAHSQPS